MAEACYVRKFAPASFKGFSFEATEAESEHGRRGAEGEFPFGENTAYADLGRRIRVYKLKARFVKNSHVADANKFIRVCESIGPGVLMHPTRGAVRAACRHAKVHDKLLEGYGETTVDLDFVEANDWINAGLALGSSLLGLSLGGITGAVQTMFDRAFGSVNVPFYDMGVLSSSAGSAVDRVRQSIDASVGISPDPVVSAVVIDMADIARTRTRALNPATLSTAITNGMAAIERYGTTTAAKVDAYRSIANWSAPTDPLSGISQPARDAVQAVMRIMGAAYLARTTMSATAANLQEGLAQYDMVVTVLDEEARIALANCDNALFLALRQFLGEAQTVLLNRAYNLPALIEYQFGGGVSSLVAAYEIYADAKRFGELEALNRRSMPFLIGPSVIAKATAP